MLSHIHHIINSYSLQAGGAERMVLNLHQGLLKAGCISHLVGLEQTDEPMQNAKSFQLKSPYSLQSLIKLRSYIQKEVQAGDIVHTHLFPSNLYLAILKKLVKKKKAWLVTTEHSTSNRRRSHWLGPVIDRFIYSGYDQVIAISQGTAKALSDWQPLLKGKITCIYNGARLHFREIPIRVKNDQLKIASVGNLRLAKNYPEALQALALLKDLPWQYSIAGEGKEKAKLQALSRELGLEDRVQWLGHVANVPELLASADIFLMSSRYEGFGLAAVEAMNAGLPVVLSDVPGLRELISLEGHEGYSVTPGRPGLMAERLRLLLQDAPLRIKMGAAAFLRSKQFSKNRMVENYLRFYQALTSS